MEATPIEPHVTRPFACLPLLALLCVLLGGCHTTARETRPVNSDDVDRSVTLPRTLQNVWYRPETQATFAVPYTAEGTLAVSAEALTFTYGDGTITIPVKDIRSVVWREMSGDRQTQWAAVIYAEAGTQKLVGFSAADGYRFNTSNKELYSAIVRAWESQPRR